MTLGNVMRLSKVVADPFPVTPPNLVNTSIHVEPETSVDIEIEEYLVHLPKRSIFGNRIKR